MISNILASEIESESQEFDILNQVKLGFAERKKNNAAKLLELLKADPSHFLDSEQICNAFDEDVFIQALHIVTSSRSLTSDELTHDLLATTSRNFYNWTEFNIAERVFNCLDSDELRFKACLYKAPKFPLYYISKSAKEFVDTKLALSPKEALNRLTVCRKGMAVPNFAHSDLKGCLPFALTFNDKDSTIELEAIATSILKLVAAGYKGKRITIIDSDDIARSTLNLNLSNAHKGEFSINRYTTPVYASTEENSMGNLINCLKFAAS